jgi:hypothetical protein
MIIIVPLKRLTLTTTIHILSNMDSRKILKDELEEIFWTMVFNHKTQGWMALINNKLVFTDGDKESQPSPEYTYLTIRELRQWIDEYK